MTDASEQRVRAEARVGTVLHGKYRVDAVLGVGGMGAVYAATHRNQKRFAVKVLHPELSLRDDLRQRFVREGYVANSLNHPGAVAILDDDVADDGSAFLVMELLDGVTVEHAWQEAPGARVAADAVIAIAHSVLDTLSAAHARSIVHRDIKPANLFLVRDGQVKVLDFGIARVKDATGAGATHTGALLGTPAFMAPEQASGETGAVDGRTDVWAVGATMFALLTGEYVHVGTTGQQLVIQAATKPARSLAAVRPELDARLVAIVDRALAFDRAERGTAAEMRDALSDAYAAIHGAPLSRLPVSALVAQHPRTSPLPTARTEKLASLPVDAPREALDPSPLFANDSLPLATTAQSVSKAAPRTTVPPQRRTLPMVAAALALVVAAMAVVVYGRLRATPGVPAPPPTSSFAPSASASPVATSSSSASLGISPSTASVEIDGTLVSVADGGVELHGAPGSMHLVRLSANGHDGTFPVLLTPAGPVPRELALATASSVTPPPRSPPSLHRRDRPSAPSASAAPPSASAPAPAPTISRTME